MMTVRLLCIYSGPEGRFEAGAVVELETHTALRLIGQNLAERVGLSPGTIIF